MKITGKIEKCKFIESNSSKLIASLRVTDINNTEIDGQMVLIHANSWSNFSVGDIIEGTLTLKNKVYYIKHISKSENPAINYNLKCKHCKSDIDSNGVCVNNYTCAGYDFSMVRHFINVIRLKDCKLYYEDLKSLKIKSILDLYAIAQDKVNISSFSTAHLNLYLEITKIITLSKNVSDQTFLKLLNIRYLKERTIDRLKNLPLIIENIKNYDTRRFSKIIDAEPITTKIKERLKLFFESDRNLKLAQTILNNREKMKE